MSIRIEDNGPAHFSRVAVAKLIKLGFQLVPQQLYIPDLPLLHCFRVHTINKSLTGQKVVLKRRWNCGNSLLTTLDGVYEPKKNLDEQQKRFIHQNNLLLTSARTVQTTLVFGSVFWISTDHPWSFPDINLSYMVSLFSTYVVDCKFMVMHHTKSKSKYWIRFSDGSIENVDYRWKFIWSSFNYLSPNTSSNRDQGVGNEVALKVNSNTIKCTNTK